MNFIKRLNQFLENHWVSPAYAGCLLVGIAVCLFAAATNTMAGWLYVISGVIFALLTLGAILPVRSLRQLKIQRQPILPVSAGDQLTIEIDIENPSLQPQNLLQVRDLLPSVLSSPKQTPIDVIPPRSSYQWVYYLTTTRRGIYKWHELKLRTATPLGLFWCSRRRTRATIAIVYPTVLPLRNCPLIDTIGQEDSTKFPSDRYYQAATEGLTRALRPYRLGDPTRLIHWRSSAKLGQWQVRELEIITGGQEVIICLDSAPTWEDRVFEQAVIAAASLYFYASRCQLNVKLWTAATGLVHGNRVVLETLAASHYGEEKKEDFPAFLPLVCLTQNSAYLDKLTPSSRWLLFATESDLFVKITSKLPGLIINPQESLQPQLQKQ